MKRLHPSVRPEFDEVGIVGVVIGVEEKRGRGTRSMRRLEPPQIDIQQGVSIKHQKLRLQPLDHSAHRSSCSKSGLLGDADDAHSPFGTVADIGGHSIGTMACQYQRLGASRSLQKIQLAAQKRAAVDLHEGLRKAPADLGKAGSLAAGQNRRLHQDRPRSWTTSAAASTTAASDEWRGLQPRLLRRATL